VTNNKRYVPLIIIQTHKLFCCHGLSQHALQSIRYIVPVPWCFLRKCYITQVSVNSWLDFITWGASQHNHRVYSFYETVSSLVLEITGFSNAVYRIVSFLTTEIQHLFGQEQLRGIDDWVKTVPVINLKKSTHIIKLCWDISGSNTKIHQDMNERNYKSHWPL
jgi:hypothetical protein